MHQRDEDGGHKREDPEDGVERLVPARPVHNPTGKDGAGAHRHAVW